MRRSAALVLAMAAMLAFPAAVFAYHVPDPRCLGQVVERNNHGSGEFGASGNVNASAGPGYFLGPSTSPVIYLVRLNSCAR
jgi:hypothetical protein